MRFLDRFRKKSPTVTDPAFGRLTFETPWWRGTVVFRPCSSEVAVSIESDEHGPADQQRSRFRELGYSFDPDVGWDDAMFNVAIEGWTPRPGQPR